MANVSCQDLVIILHTIICGTDNWITGVSDRGVKTIHNHNFIVAGATFSFESGLYGYTRVIHNLYSAALYIRAIRLLMDMDYKKNISKTTINLEFRDNNFVGHQSSFHLI